MKYGLRLRGQSYVLSSGRFVVGRGEGCQLTLDDPLASRTHAAFVLSERGLVVEDLASRNGVRVNGKKIDGAHQLAPGDIVRIGAEELEVFEVQSSPRDKGRSTVTGAETLLQNTQRIEVFGVLGSLADKALALGHGDEAERILAKQLESLIAEERPADAEGPATAPPRLDEATLRRAAEYGFRLAALTGKGRWLDYLFRLHASHQKLMEASMVDELYELARKIQGASAAYLQAYLDVLRASLENRGPRERFLIGRLEGVLALLR